MGQFEKKYCSGVLTTYKLGETAYTSYILGKNLQEIQGIANKRGLGEVIESQIMPVEVMPTYHNLTDEEILKRLPEIIHTISFLSFIALKARTISIDEVLGDEGVLHELTHLNADLSGCHKKSLTCIRDLIARLQDSAIGAYQPV